MNPPEEQSSHRYVTCRCRHCDGGIEFDASNLSEGEMRKVECPHCHLETEVSVPASPIPPIIPPDVETLQFLHKVADAGGVRAQCTLGVLYFTGQGVPQNNTEAIKWLKMAAEQGDDIAQYQLGVVYVARSAQQDFTKAVEWWRKAAEQGNALAQFNVGVCYNNGQGVAQDDIEAIKWIRKAAEQGEASAQYALAQFYDEGQDVAQDSVEAYKWAMLARAQKHKEAANFCLQIAEKMTEEQRRRGEQLYAEFIAQPEERPGHKRDIESESRSLIDFERALMVLSLDPKVTPHSLQGFVGQERTKARLLLSIQAARLRGEGLGHVLLVGQSGSGKATLGCLTAMNLWGCRLVAMRGSDIEKAGDLAGLLTDVEEGDVLLIDEIQDLQKSIAEYLYRAMRDFTLDIIIDDGPNVRSVRLNLPVFTLIGTTSRKEKLLNPLLSCFEIVENLDPYGIEELTAIARRFADALNVAADSDATRQIALSADGIPSDVLRRLRHVRDFAQVKGLSALITATVASQALKMLKPAPRAGDESDSRAAIPSTVRREVWRRDGGQCVKCGSREKLEYDHIIPLSKGGSNTARNIELLCEQCNRSKRDSIQ